MAFKLETTIGNTIREYEIPFQVVRNGYILNLIDSVYFNENNQEENKKIIVDYLYSLSESDSDNEALDKFFKNNVEFNINSLLGTWGLTEKQSHTLSNILYNLQVNVVKSWVFNLFLTVYSLPNMEYSEAAFILKSDCLNDFIEEITILYNTDKYIYSKREKSGLEIFIKDFKDGKVTNDIIIKNDFFFPEELESIYGYGNPVTLLTSSGFQDYLRNNENNFIGSDYNEIVENYIEEMGIETSYHEVFEAHKEYIKDNNISTPYLNVNNCKELIFIHSAIVEKLKV